MARPKAALVVTKVDRQVLDSMAHRARTAPQLARRARIVLACATGRDNTTVAKKLRMSKPTVGHWRQRFIDKGVDGLLDEPRPGAPRTINDTQVEAVVTRTLETTPRGATHWSTRTLAKATGVSPMRVHRLWQAFGLQPHRTKSFKLSPDPLLIDKVRDIVGLYLNPPQHAAVFCVDEKPQIQALDRTLARQKATFNHGLLGPPPRHPAPLESFLITCAGAPQTSSTHTARGSVTRRDHQGACPSPMASDRTPPERTHSTTFDNIYLLPGAI